MPRFARESGQTETEKAGSGFGDRHPSIRHTIHLPWRPGLAWTTWKSPIPLRDAPGISSQTHGSSSTRTGTHTYTDTHTWTCARADRHGEKERLK